MAWSVRRVPHPDAGGLADLIGDVPSFLAEDLFRNHRHLRGHATRLREAVSAESLWDGLLGGMTREPAFRVVRNGNTLPSSQVCRAIGMGNRNLTDVLSPNQVVDAYRSGASVSLQGLHHTDHRLARWAVNLALELDHPVQVNAYLSPPAAQALDLHFDFHDVIVVQLRGSKRWRVWPALTRAPYPVKGEATSPPMPTLDELGEPLIDTVLTPGDVLALPRGFPHAAETTDEHSDHLTFGIITVLWQKILRMSLDAEIAAGRLGESLPAGLLDGTAAPLVLPDLRGLGDHLAGDGFRHRMASEVWRRLPATRVKALAAPPVAADDPLSWVPGPLLWATAHGERAVIGLGERILDLPLEGEKILHALLAGEDGMTIEGIAETLGSDADERASVEVIARRLVDEGVLAPCPG